MPLQDPVRIQGAPPRGMGHPRTACRAGSGEEARHHQGRHRTEDKRRGLQPHLPRGGDEIYGRMAYPYRAHRLLGRHGRPLYHLRQPLHRDALVAPEADILEGTALQGQVHTALFSCRRYRAQQPRAQPAGLLPRRQGHHLRRPVQGNRRGRAVFPRVDDHSLDTPVQYRPLRRAPYRLCEGAFRQSLQRRRMHIYSCQGSCGERVLRQDALRGAARRHEGHGTRGHALRAADTLVPS